MSCNFHCRKDFIFVKMNKFAKKSYFESWKQCDWKAFVTMVNFDGGFFVQVNTTFHILMKNVGLSSLCCFFLCYYGGSKSLKKRLMNQIEKVE